jgi:hypothetical protein
MEVKTRTLCRKEKRKGCGTLKFKNAQRLAHPPNVVLYVQIDTGDNPASMA